MSQIINSCHIEAQTRSSGVSCVLADVCGCQLSSMWLMNLSSPYAVNLPSLTCFIASNDWLGMDWTNYDPGSLTSFRDVGEEVQERWAKDLLCFISYELQLSVILMENQMRRIVQYYHVCMLALSLTAERNNWLGSCSPTLTVFVLLSMRHFTATPGSCIPSPRKSLQQEQLSFPYLSLEMLVLPSWFWSPC